jgi:glutamyl-tRNA synthetase
VEFQDRLHGSQEGRVDDFVLRRGDGTPGYQLATVVDDADMGIGEVVRGDDLLDSTPRQLLLFRLLGLTAPSFAHVPLVLGRDHTRLAKRHGAVTLADRARLGESPADVLTWMGRSLDLLGEDEHAERPGDLLERFDPERLPREPAVLR